MCQKFFGGLGHPNVHGIFGFGSVYLEVEDVFAGGFGFENGGVVFGKG